MSQSSLKKLVQSILLSSGVGILSGLSVSLFLYLLNIVTTVRIQNYQIIYLLPFVGFLISFLFMKYGSEINSGTNLYIEEVSNPKKTIPLYMVPFVLISTLLSHLFGGSVGREATAVQMGAAFADQISKKFRVIKEERKALLMAGAGSAFAAALGAPFAGMFFGGEVVHSLKFREWRVLESFVASFIACLMTQLLSAQHTLWPRVIIPEFSLSLFVYVVVSGICFGLITRAFILVLYFVENVQKKYIHYSPLRPFIAGLLIVILYKMMGTYRYAGLGLDAIQDSFLFRSSLGDPFYKVIFTALSVGSGFKGGEYVPLVFIGATLGSALSILQPTMMSLLASLGFTSVFAAASKTPLTCIILAAELFGIEILPYAIIACLLSFVFSGKSSIYSAQKKYNI